MLTAWGGRTGRRKYKKVAAREGGLESSGLLEMRG